jgi:hypothetical protein
MSLHFKATGTQLSVTHPGLAAVRINVNLVHKQADSNLSMHAHAYRPAP